MDYKSPRVLEVLELHDLLCKNHIVPHFALRTAVECVYGMKEDFYRHNNHIDTPMIQEAEDACWNVAHDEKIKRGEE